MLFWSSRRLPRRERARASTANQRAKPLVDRLSGGAAPTLFPQPLEAATGHARVVHGMPRIAIPEIVLHGAQVGPLVGKIVAAGRSCQRLTALGQEQPR